jgi:hypothetical protein
LTSPCESNTHLPSLLSADGGSFDLCRTSRLVNAALHCSSFSPVKEAKIAVLEICLHLLQCDKPLSTQSALSGLSEFLQCQVITDTVLYWKQQVISELCPFVALITKRGLSIESPHHDCVSIGVPILIHACSLQAGSPSLQDRLLILVSILVEAAEVHQFKDMSVKALSSLPSHPSLGSPFSDCLRRLSSDVKSRLQVSIKAVATPRADDPSSAQRSILFPLPPISSISKGPVIQLKRFT